MEKNHAARAVAAKRAQVRAKAIKDLPLEADETFKVCHTVGEALKDLARTIKRMDVIRRTHPLALWVVKKYSGLVPLARGCFTLCHETIEAAGIGLTRHNAATSIRAMEGRIIERVPLPPDTPTHRIGDDGKPRRLPILYRFTAAFKDIILRHHKWRERNKKSVGSKDVLNSFIKREKKESLQLTDFVSSVGNRHRVDRYATYVSSKPQEIKKLEAITCRGLPNDPEASSAGSFLEAAINRLRNAIVR